MGKKKLTEKQKKEIATQRKKKEKETRDIILALSKQNQNQEQAKILNNCKSVKHIATNQKELKKAKNEVLYQKNKKNSKQIELEDEEEDQEEDQIEPTIQKKQKIEQPIQQEETVNIFAMSNFVNKDYQEQDMIDEEKEKDKEPQTKHEIQAQLENQAKKAFPDLNFEVFEGQKTIKRIQEQDFNSKKQEKEEIQESDHEEIVDEQLVQLVKLYKKQTVQINRTEEIQSVREKLPVFFKEQEILEAVNQNLITILCGQTGSGKSTQVPQFLYEAGYGNPNGQNPGLIGITQPRRLAAVSLAKRVSEELNLNLGEEVIYQVRHESSNFDTEKSKIKFMTDGILLNEMGSDFLLTKYSVIVIDEAHERKINTDLLLGLLSRLVNIRLKLALEKKGKYFPLRVIIMSATLRITDFTENKYLLPKKVNVINVEARQFPVNIYFSKRTNLNYIEEAVKKCVLIHTKLPPGDVLVFLTGEREIKEFMILLESALQKKKKNFESIRNKQNNLYLKNEDFELNSDDEDENDENLTEEQRQAKQEERKKLKENDEENTKIISHNPLQSEFPEEFEAKEGETDKEKQEKEKKGKKIQDEFQNFVILPLYSKLSMEEQDKIFKKQENVRMFVISTNVAETSLTIPNTKYVVDTGKEKKKVFTSKLAISKHIVSWTSQASGNQRTGRAGRTCAGYCYRLYAPSVFGNIMETFSDPEILNTPLENVILHLKNIGIKDVLQFPFPTRPDVLNLNLSLQNLIKLKALELPQEEEHFNNFDQDDNYIGDRDNRIKIQTEDAQNDNTTITELGKVMSYIPLNPKFSKMILQGRSAGLLGYTLLIVSYLSVEEIFNKDAFKVQVDTIDKSEYENLDYQDMEDEHEAKRKELKDNLTMLKEIKDKQKLIYEARKQEITNFKTQFNTYLLGKSDIFVGMNILGEFICYLQKVEKYEIDQKIAEFAKEKGLLSKALKEIYFNLNQLIEILDSLIENQQEKQEEIQEFFKNYVQPDQENIQTLTEIVISGFVDKVARKITYLDDKNLKKIAYETIETLEKVFINPKSYQSSAKPDFVCYTEITETKKKFINNITTIDQMSWLYKYDFYNKRGVEYLKEPRPQYNAKLDQLQVKVNYQFGPKKWDLPAFWSTYENESYIKYCHFARNLMDGQVFDYFKVIKKFYNMNIQMIKPSNLNPGVTGIINGLKNNNLDSKQKLKEMWEQQPNFLKEEVLYWIRKENKKSVQSKWPPKI